MKILSQLISEKNTELVSSLVNGGFTKEQAENFLPEAGKIVINTIDGRSGLSLIKITNLLASGQTDSLMDKVNITDLASKTGLESALVYNGFHSLLPAVMKLLKHNSSNNFLVSDTRH